MTAVDASAQPAKRRDGYANFAITEPPLKLVLIAGEGRGGTLNHLGVEVATSDEVTAATHRLNEQGLATETEDGVACCYALQDKVWVHDPSGVRSREAAAPLRRRGHGLLVGGHPEGVGRVVQPEGGAGGR